MSYEAVVVSTWGAICGAAYFGSVIWASRWGGDEAAIVMGMGGGPVGFLIFLIGIAQMDGWLL